MRRRLEGLELAVTGALLSLAASGTVWLATVSWTGFIYDEWSYLRPLLWLALLVAVTGYTGRLLRLGVTATFLAQLVLVGGATCWLVGGSPLPVGEGWTTIVDAVRAAVATSVRLAPPVPAGGEGGVGPLLLFGGVGCLLLVDLVACGLRRPSVAGLALLAVVSVPFGVLGRDVAWWVFALTTAGFLTVLGLHETDLVGRWGRRLDDDTPLPRPARGAAFVGGTATLLAVMVPATVPVLDLQLLDIGAGSGGGDQITVSNPIVDLQRRLVQGPDEAAIRVVTDDPEPSYLRIAVLTKFSDNEWTAGDRDVPSDQDAEGKLPPPRGLSPDVRLKAYDYQLQVYSTFESKWLPTQQDLREIHAAGDWRYDTTTMDFLSYDEDLTTAGLSYSFTAVEPRLTSDDLESAMAGSTAVDSLYRDLPDNLPPMVGELARQVTRDATSSFERAVALQQWFRVGGGFRYDTSVALGSSPDDLVSFLSDGPGGRTGFCQQFAAAMAVMARELGIPARVAVGFLSPDPSGDGAWIYSTRDMHAWPELYFSGYGWVAFEPTPSDRVEDTPAYTHGIGVGDDPSGDPSSSASAPVGQQSGGPQPRLDEQPQTDTGTGDGGGGFPLTELLGTVFALALLAAAGLVPMVVRRRRRARRLTGTPEEVWAELRDTVVDLGLDWPAGLSPRATAERLRPAVLTDSGTAGLDAIVAALEATRYSTRPAEGSLAVELAAVIEGLEPGVTRASRRRAEWWPRSIVGRDSLRRRLIEPGEESDLELVDHAVGSGPSPRP